MESSVFVRGLAIGFSIAAPVGPIGVLCIRRTLAEGRASGLVSGLGAASADMIYGCIAGFGLTFLSDFLVDQRVALHIIGGTFLCYLGVRTFLAKPEDKAAIVEGQGLFRAFVSTFFLTLANPMTILSFAAVFAGLGLADDSRSYSRAISIVMGVFVGSASWWLFLSGGVGVLREKFDTRTLRWVNRLSGVVITGFGLSALLRLS